MAAKYPTLSNRAGHVTVFSGKVIYTQLPTGTVTTVSAGETITLN